MFARVVQEMIQKKQKLCAVFFLFFLTQSQSCPVINAATNSSSLLTKIIYPNVVFDLSIMLLLQVLDCIILIYDVFCILLVCVCVISTDDSNNNNVNADAILIERETQQRLYRKNLTLLKHPLSCIYLFLLTCVDYSFELFYQTINNTLLMLIMIPILIIISIHWIPIPIPPFIITSTLPIYIELEWILWWFLLGVLSSIGFGIYTMHTQTHFTIYTFLLRQHHTSHTSLFTIHCCDAI